MAEPFETKYTYLTALKPFLSPTFRNYLSPDNFLTSPVVVQYLEIVDAPFTFDHDYSLIYVSDSDFKIIAKLTRKSLLDHDKEIFNKMIPKKGCLVTLIEYAFSIERIGQYQPPILIINKFSVSFEELPIKGNPKYIIKGYGIANHLDMLITLTDMNASFAKLMNKMPPRIKSTFNIDTTANKIDECLSEKFINFCSCFDRLIAGKIPQSVTPQFHLSDSYLDNLQSNDIQNKPKQPSTQPSVEGMVLTPEAFKIEENQEIQITDIVGFLDEKVVNYVNNIVSNTKTKKSSIIDVFNFVLPSN